MKTLKTFEGFMPPELRRWELANNGQTLFVRNDKNRILRFLSVRWIKRLIAIEIEKQLLEQQE